jgi:AP-2 complex subunit alpha
MAILRALSAELTLLLYAEDGTLRILLHNVLERILKNSQETPRNAQHNNAQNSVLFEAINLAIHLDTESTVVHAAAHLLGRFISAKETNVRYLGLDTMAHLAARSESLDAIKVHQPIIIQSLRDKDISVRRRGLDLLYSMCDTTNSKTIVAELLKYLQVADYTLREEMVLKIAILTEKFAVEYEWYVDTILRLMSTAGDHVGEEVWYRIVQIVTNTEELQEVSLSFAQRSARELTSPRLVSTPLARSSTSSATLRATRTSSRSAPTFSANMATSLLTSPYATFSTHLVCPR